MKNILGRRVHQHLSIFGTFSEEKIPYFEILSPTTLLQIYPFLSEIMDERDGEGEVVFSAPSTGMAEIEQT